MLLMASQHSTVHPMVGPVLCMKVGFHFQDHSKTENACMHIQDLT